MATAFFISIELTKATGKNRGNLLLIETGHLGCVTSWLMDKTTNLSHPSRHLLHSSVKASDARGQGKNACKSKQNFVPIWQYL